MPRQRIASIISLALPVLSVLALSAHIVAALGGASSDSITAPMAVEWKYTGSAFPNNPSAPLVSGDTVFYASGGRVYALNSETGSKKWVYPSGTQLPNPVQAPLSTDGKTLFVPGGGGLYSLDMNTGLPKFPQYRVGSTGIVTTPVVVGDGVYFISGNDKLYGLHTDTGTPLSARWGKGLEIGSSSVGDMVAHSGILYFVTSNMELRAVDAATGAERWNVHFNGTASSVTPTVSGDNLYVAVGQTLYCLRINNGQLIWSIPSRDEYTCPAGGDAEGNAYVVTSSLYVYAINPLRKPIWKEPARVDFPVNAAPLAVGNLLIVGTSFGGVDVFNRTTGHLKWNFAIQATSLNPNTVPKFNRILATPVVSGNQLYVLTDDGSLTAFSPNAVDTIPPTITPLAPLQGEYVNGRPPFLVEALISDFGSGLRPDSVTLTVDSQQILHVTHDELTNGKTGFTFNKDTGLLKYTIEEQNTGVSNTLLDGHHFITVTAEDWMGNKKNKVWVFTTGDSFPLEKALQQQNNQGNQQGGNRNRSGFGGGGGGRKGGGGGGGG